MRPLFNKTFFKFTGRFVFIIFVSVAGLFLITYFQVQGQGSGTPAVAQDTQGQ